MTAYQHAEAHERLMDLALEPDTLRQFADALAQGGPPEAEDPLLAHVLTCAMCRDVVASWERTHETVRRALTSGAGERGTTLADLAEDTPTVAPAELRSALLQRVAGAAGAGAMGVGAVGAVAGDEAPRTVVEEGQGGIKLMPRVAAVPRGRVDFGRRWLPMVAVLAVVAVAGGLVLNESARLDQAHRETAALEVVAATVDRVLRDPSHTVVDLRSADGAAAGSISWSSHDLVVLTSALQPPPDGQLYACWIERDGTRSPVGQMWFAGGTAYWTGSLDGWATTSFGSGTFGISLEPVNGPRGHPAVLVGNLGT